MNALQATDEIYNAALQILSGYQVDAELVPLVMGTVAQRLDAFALGAMAHDKAALQAEVADLKQPQEPKEE